MIDRSDHEPADDLPLLAEGIAAFEAEVAWFDEVGVEISQCTTGHGQSGLVLPGRRQPATFPRTLVATNTRSSLARREPGQSRFGTMAVIKVQDMHGQQYVVFDGEFIERLPAVAGNVVRRHVSEFTDVSIEHKPAKKKRLFGGETKEHWEVLIHCGAFIALWVDAEEKPKLEELAAALKAARDSPA